MQRRPSHAELSGVHGDEEAAPLSLRDELQRWRIHDRTHLELPVEYRLDRDDREHFEWEAYFFMPRSFRLDRSGYSKDDIYADFQSYVRLAAPRLPLGEAAEQWLPRLQRALDAGDVEAATREMRILACSYRRATLKQRRRLLRALEQRDPRMPQQLQLLLDGTRALSNALRACLKPHSRGDSRTAAVARWIEEDLSLVVEMMLSRVVEQLRAAEVDEALVKPVVDAAVAEARYRRKVGFDAVGGADLDGRAIEHLEFRRHTLKRFTASVLWLTVDAKEPGRWARHVLFAVAAGVAMAFAVAATLWNGPTATERQLSTWLLIAVIAYAIKDRMKASLQDVFSRLLSRRIPDRRWLVRERDGKRILGKVDARSAFVGFDDLPEAVLAARRMTRQHAIEEVARPETVLWHRKNIEIDAARIADADSRIDSLVEIFRLDIGRWLTHTHDPKNRVVYADPERAEVASVVAPRVYNVAIVYRVRRAADENAVWRRVRVVVSRKGLRRIDTIC